MASTTDVTPTALQAPIHTDNIVAHPGSTFAGAGVAAVLLAFVQANPWPTSAAGWFAYGAAAVMAVLAALGK